MSDVGRHGLTMRSARLRPLPTTAGGHAKLSAVADTPPLPRLVERDSRHSHQVDDASFLMLGGQGNNSSAGTTMWLRVCDRGVVGTEDGQSA